MIKSMPAARNNVLYPVFIMTLILTAVGITGWTTTFPSRQGLDVQIPIPTLASSFAFAEIAKPTYTAIPTTVPPLSQPLAITPTSIVQAEIVLDSSISQNIATIGEDNTSSDSPSPTYEGNKFIQVDISEQHMYMYEGDTLVNNFVSSTGMNNSTRAGNFSVLNKIPSAYGATWNIWMPNWLGIYWSGSLQNGIHALPILSNGGQLWAGYLGIPISYGCVVLGVDEAQWLYDWAEIGTPVEIQR